MTDGASGFFSAGFAAGGGVLFYAAGASCFYSYFTSYFYSFFSSFFVSGAAAPPAGLAAEVSIS